MADLTTLLAGFLNSLYASVGLGTAFIKARGRTEGATAAVPSVCTYTVGAADETIEAVATVSVTTATTHSFSVQCAYTDETNTARTITMPFRLLADTTSVQGVVVNTNGAVPYLGIGVTVRAKAGTTVTILTQAGGTYTTVVFNVEGLILRKV